MDDEIIRLLKKISNDVDSLKDDMRLIHAKLTALEKNLENVNEVYEDVENVRSEINKYFELRNPMS